MARITLCLNCLTTSGIYSVPVGYPRGNQMDPYQDSIDLCGTCKNALVTGDFETLAARHTNERTITVGAQGER